MINYARQQVIAKGLKVRWLPQQVTFSVKSDDVFASGIYLDNANEQINEMTKAIYDTLQCMQN